MFSYQPPYYTTSPFDSYFVQPDPYRRAALIQRQREIEAARLAQARQEQARLAEARRIQQLRRQQEEAELREAYMRQLRNQRRSQYFTQPVESEDDEEEQYYQHPFFPFAFGPQRTRRSSVQRRPQREAVPEQVSELARSTTPTPVADSSEQHRARPASVHIPVSGDDTQKQAEAVKITTPPNQPQLSNERRNAAATAIQTLWRSYSLRSKAIAQISAIRDSFQSLQSSFIFPTTVDFAETSSQSTPSLAYTANNRPILSYEHDATKLLTQLDAVDSAGDVNVRAARKALVIEIEDALKAVESKKSEAWIAQHAPVDVTSIPLPTSPVLEAVTPSSSTSDLDDAEMSSQSDEEEEAAVQAAVSEPEDIVIVDERDADEDEDDDAWVDARDEVIEDEKDAEVVNMQLDDSSLSQ